MGPKTEKQQQGMMNHLRSARELDLILEEELLTWKEKGLSNVPLRSRGTPTSNIESQHPRNAKLCTLNSPHRLKAQNFHCLAISEIFPHQLHPPLSLLAQSTPRTGTRAMHQCFSSHEIQASNSDFANLYKCHNLSHPSANCPLHSRLNN